MRTKAVGKMQKMKQLAAPTIPTITYITSELKLV